MAGRRNSPHGGKSAGFALLALLTLLTLGTLGYFVGQLDSAKAKAQRLDRTRIAMAQAVDAIRGYMVRYRDVQAAQGDSGRMYGYLPMPDLGSTRNQNNLSPCNDREGCEANTPNGISLVDGLLPTLVGRLPWRTLGIEPLRDGYGECLWLIVAAPSLAKNASNTSTAADPPRMNPDTLGQFDIVSANGTAALQSELANAHQRPTAIVFSPGPVLGQVRSTGSDDVTECGGSYDASLYLDAFPANVRSNFLDGTNHASDAATTRTPSRVDDPDPAQSVSIRGRLFSSGSTYVAHACTTCTEELANDQGRPLRPDENFSLIRRNGIFRSDIDSLIRGVGTCLENAGAFTPDAMTGTADAYRGKVPESANCTAGNLPAGYFDHYREQMLVAVVGDATAIANCKSGFDTTGNCLDVTIREYATGQQWPKKCHAVLIFSGQRGAAQVRASDADRKDPKNYLEDPNLNSFRTANTFAYSGADKFHKVTSGFPAHTDIVRCIPEAGYSTANPTGAPLKTIVNSAMTPYGGQLSSYDSTSGTLTLGLVRTSANFPSAVQTDLYGCAWQTETFDFSKGLRSYFRFRINDAILVTTPLDGFAFTVVDGNLNSTDACGAARQHLGYSGNNLDTPWIKPPKIGIEVDLRRNFSGTSGFNPSGTNTLTNGRSDPNYTGGHVGIVYWGGDTDIDTTIAPASCTAPRVLVGGVCTLPAVEDDNVHGYPASSTSCRPPPPNPAAPTTPTLSSGAYKLDPNLSAIPVNQDYHLRVEITRGVSVAPTILTVRAATTATLNLASPGASMDGVALTTGDRVLVRQQSAPAENGVYVWSAAGSALTRSIDMDSATELAGAFIAVAEGTTYGGTLWRQSAIAPSPGTDPQYWSRVAVRLAASSNIDLLAPGATIDGLAVSVGDRILLRNQTTASENGIYVWKGASTSLAPDQDADTANELAGMIVRVDQGTDALTWWRYDGTSWSSPQVRISTQSAIDLAAPGASIDGCTSLVAGDRILVRHQSNPAENGIYVWNGAATPLVRAADFDSSAELAGSLIQVQEGSDIGRAFRQSALGGADTLDSASIQWLPVDASISPAFVVQAWILPDSLTDANRITLMQDTARAMSTMDSSFTPHLKDSPTIYHAFRRARLGFTVGQSISRNDQTVSITNHVTTWLQ